MNSDDDAQEWNHPWERPDDSDHYLDLEGASLVATDAVLATKENLGITIAEKAMMCLHGESGVGKTLSVMTALRNWLTVETLRIELRSHPYTRDIRGSLFQALGFGGEPPKHPLEYDRLLKAALSQRFRVLVCDEAQWMSHEGFELWRHLWDDRHTTFALIFVGGGDCYRVLRRYPMLSSRVLVWQEYRSLSATEVPLVIPSFHPVWASVDPELITLANESCAHGNFRAWAALTVLVQRGMKLFDRPHVDRELLQWAFEKLGGSR